MKRSSKIPTAIGVFLLMIGVGAGVFLVNRAQIFRLGASPDRTPKDVRVTNISNNSFSVSWVTDKETQGFVKWGETSTLGKTMQEGTSVSTAHLITINGLTPGRNYFFKVNSDGVDFDNNGAPWNTNTQLSTPSSNIARISGTILGQNGIPEGGVIIYVDGAGVDTLSTITSSSGNWTISVPVLSDTNLKTTLVSIYAQGGIKGISTAQAYLGNANPLPQMTLGQTHDFKNISNSTTSGDTIPEINLPETTEGTSRFDDSVKTAVKDTSVVTITNISEGETVFTDKPQIIGEGPKNTTITITVHSDEAITQTVKIASSGDWAWTPPANLSPGEHTVTISWKDASGILRTLTKSFVVEVNAQEPSFVSTPSGSTSTPSPTPLPTSTATPTIKPTVTPTASASATPRVTTTPTVKPTQSSASDSALPNAGVSGFSVALILFGAVLFFGGIFVSKKST